MDEQQYCLVGGRYWCERFGIVYVKKVLCKCGVGELVYDFKNLFWWVVNMCLVVVDDDRVFDEFWIVDYCLYQCCVVESWVGQIE